MKTIDLLVQELPALGGFPEGAVEAGFLCSDDTLYFADKDGDCPSEWRISMNYEVEDRWVEVTRDQYEAALAAKNDEADLNECIGKDAVLVWNGEGVIPPVGCVCERSWAGDEWQSCKILFASGQIVVVKLKESGREDAYNIGDVTFRPIRPIHSEAEQKREEVVKVITLTGWCQTAAEEIYDLVAAGKVPGMKLED